MRHSIFSYLNVQVSRKREAGKESTADLYRVVQNRLYRFAAGKPEWACCCGIITAERLLYRGYAQRLAACAATAF